MTEKDRKFVDRLRERIDGKKIKTVDTTLVSILLDITDRLDAENGKLKADLDKVVNALVKP